MTFKLSKLSMRAIAAAMICTSLPLAAALAQDAPAAAAQPDPAPESNGCELHVWPAERFMSMSSGLLGPSLLDAVGHAEGDRRRKAAMANALDSPSQLAALTSLDLVGLLKQRQATVITHAEPLERHTINTIKTRRSDSKSPYYSELFVADLFYQKAALSGRSLKSLFIYRDFGSSQTATRIYKNWGGNGLKLFPPKPGEDIEAANNELVTVFKSDFQEFARNEATQTAQR